MTAAKHLPIYRDAYRLVAHLHQVTRKAPRDLRHTLVQRLLDEAVECCVDIADANRASGPARAARIDRLTGRISRVDTLLTIAMEQHCLSTGAAAVAMEHADALALTLHPGKTRLQPATHGVDWVGYVIKPHRTYLRRTTATRAAQRIRYAPADDLLTTTNSYLGIAAHANTWTQRGTWCASAAARGLVPAPDRRKVMARPAPSSSSTPPRTLPPRS